MAVGRKRFLNAGSGPKRQSFAHRFFPHSQFEEVRIDVEPAVAPDIVGSFCDMRDLVEDASFDAVWSSHSLEHLADHEAPLALREFRRVLRPDGFALVTCPNLAAIASLLATREPEDIVYYSAAGPIRALDLLFGHAPSIAAGYGAMAHRTGFTPARLGRLATEAGFAEARVLEGPGYDLWALLLMKNTDAAGLADLLAGANIAALAPMRQGGQSPAEAVNPPTRAAARA